MDIISPVQAILEVFQDLVVSFEASGTVKKTTFIEYAEYVGEEIYPDDENSADEPDEVDPEALGTSASSNFPLMTYPGDVHCDTLEKQTTVAPNDPAWNPMPESGQAALFMVDGDVDIEVVQEQVAIQNDESNDENVQTDLDDEDYQPDDNGRDEIVSDEIEPKTNSEDDDEAEAKAKPKKGSASKGRKRKRKIPDEELPFESKFRICPSCGKSFEKNSYNFHIKICNVAENPFSCKDCGRLFKTQRYLNSHQYVHLPRDQRPHWKCDICGWKSYSKTNFNKHKVRHITERPYSCQYCNKQFSRAHGVRVHERIHTGEKPYACQFCEKAFGTHLAFQLHTRTHTGEKPYSCQYCDKKFIGPTARNVSSWTSHVRLPVR